MSIETKDVTLWSETKLQTDKLWSVFEKNNLKEKKYTFLGHIKRICQRYLKLVKSEIMFCRRI